MTLWPYLTAVAVTLVVAVIGRQRLRRATSPSVLGQLSLEEIAYLAGGPTRVVESAVAGLLERNAVRISRRGVLEETGAQPPLSDAESAVLAVMDGGRRRVRWTISTCAVHNAVTQVGADLVARNLLVDPHQGRRRLWLAASPLMVVLIVGVVGLATSEQFADAVGVLPVIIAALLLFATLRRPVSWRTTPGDAALRTATGGAAGGSARPALRQESGMVAALPITSAAALVAVHGLSAYPDKTVRRALTRNSRSSSSSSSGSCSSSCGGPNDSGGGGCGSSCGGGCGGGGGGD